MAQLLQRYFTKKNYQKTNFSFSGSSQTEEEDTAEVAPPAEVRKINTTNTVKT